MYGIRLTEPRYAITTKEVPMSTHPELTDKCHDCEITFAEAEAYEPMFDDNDEIIGHVCGDCYLVRTNGGN